MTKFLGFTNLGFWCVVILAHTMQGKNWTCTVNNWSPKDIEDMKGWDVQYMLMSAEIAPETGTPHLQGWVQFKTNMRMSAVKKVHGKAHWELMRGSIDSNEAYCRKDGQVMLEIGEIKSRER